MSSASAPTAERIVAWLRHFLVPGQPAALWVKAPRDGDWAGFKQLTCYFTDHAQLVREALRLDGHCAGLYVTLNPIDEKQLSAGARQAFNGETSPKVKPPKNEHIARRKLLLIDCDPNREGIVAATAKEWQLAYDRAMAVGRYLDKQGWPRPAIVDSGNGVYLVYRVKLPADDEGIVRGVLAALAEKFSDEHVTIDRAVSPAKQLMRLPGTMNCKGENTTQRPWRRSRLLRVPKEGLRVVPTKLLKLLADNGGSSEPASNDKAHAGKVAGVDPLVIAHARKYLEAMPEAVEGQGGGMKALLAARAIVVGFDIPCDSEEAWQLLLHYNETRCRPPWKPYQYNDLRRKLRDADERARQEFKDRGYLKVSGLRRQFEPLAGPDFPIQIPDYSLLDAKTIDCVLESPPVPHAYGLRMFAVWQHKRADVLVPDRLVKLTHWGARPPRNWRPQYRKGITQVNKQFREHPKQCRSGCLLYGTGLRHRHCGLPFEPNGILDDFKSDDDPAIDCDSELFQEHRKAGRIYWGYWPALIFGMSKPVGLTASQVRLLMAITRELTRTSQRPVRQGKKGKAANEKVSSDRQDRAEVFTGGEVTPSGRGHDRIVCPLLDKDEEYVGFCGNLRGHRGRGYRAGGWVVRMGREPTWENVEAMLGDLAVLAQKFDLKVAARHHDEGRWFDLEKMREMCESASGRGHLNKSMLRVYAPADFLVLWRYRFAQWLGFGWIPGGEPRPFVADHDDVRDSEVLRRLLKDRGLTHEALAEKMGVSRETIGRNLRRRQCSVPFWKKLQSTLARM